MSYKIIILGSDRRMKYAGERLCEKEFEVCYEYNEIGKADFVLLPVPVADAEGYISGSEIRLSTLLHALRPGIKVYGGMVPEEMSDYCRKTGIQVQDYMKCEELTIKNAELTAKGIISEAECAGAVLLNSKTLVTGYGKCGRKLAEALRNAGADAEIMVRRKEAMLEAENDGFTAVDMFGVQDEKERKKMDKYSYVFNTIPAPVLNTAFISCLSSNVMIFDIASRPGGTDFNYCRENGIFALLSLGIPGRHYPDEAGRIIADVILNDVKKENYNFELTGRVDL